jgi:hypothetical protein
MRFLSGPADILPALLANIYPERTLLRAPGRRSKRAGRGDQRAFGIEMNVSQDVTRPAVT